MKELLSYTSYSYQSLSF